MATGIKGAGNATFTYNSNALTAYVDQQQLNMVVAELEATTLNDSAEVYAPGLASFDATIEFKLWDATLDGYLQADLLTPGTKRTAAIAFTDSGGSTVTYTWTSNAFPVNYTITANPNELINAGAGIRLSGAPGRAVS